MAKTQRTKQKNQKQVAKRVKFNREEELNEMYAAAAALVDSAGLDATLDKTLEKRFLAKFRLNNPKLAPYIGELQPYVKTFPREFYEQIYRLHNWSITPESIRNRPGIVGAWTIELVYKRFPSGMVEELRSRNPRLSSGDLLHKHFQLLTTEGMDKLNDFIQEAIDMMKSCTYWTQFMSKFARKCGKVWQSDIFDNLTD